jgi:hypothetical protein
LELDVKSQIQGVLSHDAVKSSLIRWVWAQARVTNGMSFGTWNRVCGRIPKLQNSKNKSTWQESKF